MELTSENVTKVFMSCLFKEDTPENRAKAIMVEGIVNCFGFSPSKIEAQEGDISSMLKQLPHQFRVNGGGGWSSLNACQREDGVQWGEQVTMEQLLTMGIAAGWAKYSMPRDMWKVLPGGMPYFMILSEREVKGVEK